MTVRELMSTMLRRWYIPIGLLVCAALVTGILARDGGIYTTKTVVSFMRPASTSLSPTNGANDTSVIAFAGVVVRETNNGRPPARYSTSDSPYYGAGVREGVLVDLANSGSQWASTFSKSDIEIQIVGRTFDWVKTRQKEVVDRVLSISDAEQAALEIPSDDRITATVAPITMQIDYVSPSRKSQVATGAAMLAVALIVGAWGSITVDRLRVRRRFAAGSQTQVSSQRNSKGTSSCI
ncbi:hypothetical protein [Cryobacterium psychrophilum]|uniref:Polysaccharide chain length determinant N-terminal domain-containing protein n=1 Tax=Cryobacterium psychrophilum TaxID=41988 RepID=A0A4Y8KJS9_9MICO|nr:hypothetical protein [Cryobacterium psychrophilum]TDW29930.1 hypothetical protein EDD25_1655 [Cryobacterium psychrophilum]TFD76494.1 hypothetical protein E3T53_13510 [Cryobacterium psychrophilum]